MRSSTTSGRRFRIPGRALFVALLVAGTACGANADQRSSHDDGAAITVGAPAARSTSGAGGDQQLIPAPVAASGPQGASALTAGRSPDAARQPPVPSLDRLRPEPPPNTVSLEELHRRGETHVLR